ncbi:nuclear transport factor 2 family protein [Kibdelosporangium philippinense]|uniref:Nuclear transport factor 2 family protein n=2 Tax=Kibdelosporangium philippinense TaxID=211113 RepID=A0ABS8ZR72_9PSEU|nr:nuclear transport factor 2 family protein [Kibdelosporangium philippinense]MCE7010249.1 nuclear transport factor 2 family protein [Kibdelosporangium philippinense]
MTVANLDDFKALEPFFDVIKEGLKGKVDGEQFFDLLADDIVTEFVVTVPSYPRRVEGRDALAELYRPYGDTMQLESAGDLAVHYDREASVVVLEYSVQGHVVETNRPYTNRFVSVITVTDGKVTHWRDYLDSYAVMQAFNDDLPAWE